MHMCAEPWSHLREPTLQRGAKSCSQGQKFEVIILHVLVVHHLQPATPLWGSGTVCEISAWYMAQKCCTPPGGLGCRDSVLNEPLIYLKHVLAHFWDTGTLSKKQSWRIAWFLCLSVHLLQWEKVGQGLIACTNQQQKTWFGARCWNI